MNFLNYSKDIMSLIKQGERDQLDKELMPEVNERQLPKLDIPDEELEQLGKIGVLADELDVCLLYTSPSPRDS